MSLFVKVIHFYGISTPDDYLMPNHVYKLIINDF